MPDSVRAAVLALADLHLGASYDDEADLPRFEWGFWARATSMGNGIENYFANRCGAHNKAALRALPRYLQRVLAQLRQKEGYQHYEFDAYVLLGDLVTWPSPAAFSFLIDYVTQFDFPRYTGSLSKIPGLKIPPSKLVAIPGNHDKLMYPDSQIFSKQFRRGLQIEVPDPQGAVLRELDAGGFKLRFLAIDASLYTTDKALRLTLDARKHLASGEISEGLIEHLRVYAPTLAQHDQAINFLVIHYPLDYGSVSALSQYPLNTILPHHCKDIERVLEIFPDGTFDVALHGHLHSPTYYRYASTQTVAVGTSLQRGASNDFLVLKLYESGQIRGEHHVWGKNQFRPSDQLRKPLN